MKASQEPSRADGVLHDDDRLLIEVQALAPYQGTSEPRELRDALDAAHCTASGLRKLALRPRLSAQSASRVRQALRACYAILDLPSCEPTAGPVREFLTDSAPLLLSYSVPSLLPTLEKLVAVTPHRDELHGTALQWSADASHYLKKYERCGLAYERLLAWATDRGDVRRQAHAYRGLGDRELKRGGREKALCYYDRAYAMYGRVQARASIARTSRNLGDVNRSIGRLKEVDRWYMRAADLSQRLGERWHLAKALQEWGWNTWLGGSPSLARRLFGQAARRYSEIGRARGRFTCLFALARLSLDTSFSTVLLAPSKEEQLIGAVLGHRPWMERAMLLGLDEVQRW